MNMPLSDELIAEANAREIAALDEDYDALGRKLSRTGIDIDAIKARVATFSVAVPSWGAGRGRHAVCQVPHCRRADQHSREAGRLRRHPAAVPGYPPRFAALPLGQG